MLLITKRENRILQTTNDNSILYFCVDVLENFKLKFKGICFVSTNLFYVYMNHLITTHLGELIRVDIIKMSYRTIGYSTTLSDPGFNKDVCTIVGECVQLA